MALYTGRLLMRGGNESDFDPDKMMPREWAVSTDRKIVRICVSPGEVIRMATYDAFEKDMAKIENILKECQTIQEAVVRINAEVSQNADAVAEYTAQAKKYRDEAKTSADNAKTSETNAKTSETNAKSSETNAKVSEEHAQAVFESLPEDYSTLSKEFYDVAIKQKASGEEIHVTDSSNAKVREFALFGKARQQTTTGKNLLKNTATSKSVNGITFTVNEDGSVIANGTATADAYLNISGDIDNVYRGYKLNGCPANGTNGTYRIIFQNLNEQGVWQSSSADIGMGVLLNSEHPKCRIEVNIRSGTTVNNITFYPMISLEGGEYEPYTNGASPNPDYPQEIEVPSGDVVVKSTGEQLLKYDAWKVNEIRNGTGVFENNGVTLTATTNDCYTMQEKYPTDARIEVNEGDIITLSWEEDTNTLGDIYIFGNGKVGGHAVTNNKVAKHLTYNVPSGITFITFRFGVSLSGNTISYKNIMINKGSEPLPFEPYKETTATIPVTDFAGIPVSSGGNYTDSNGQQWIANEIVKYADGSGEYVKRVGKEVFDGSEDEEWAVMTTNTESKKRNYTKKLVGIIKPYYDTLTKDEMLCTHYIAVPAGSYGTYGAKIGISVNSTGEVIIYDDNFDTSDVSLWTSHLSENPITVFYKLAEPITTPLTAEEIAEIEKLSTFYPVTNISNDADCGMSVTYLADSKNYIDSKIAELATAMVNNI